MQVVTVTSEYERMHSGGICNPGDEAMFAEMGEGTYIEPPLHSKRRKGSQILPAGQGD